ncbi:L-threonylcarbamoyladenylate synthase [Xanthobacter sp. TB0139]|uniref:L-threonylcarbamoyladenylate synthase n=1 Tax=Xanthobacter sp. TB0139 TaxID=3459178 RepID=UPI004039FE3C
MPSRRTQTLSASNPASIDIAADLLRSGGLVAFPTETVYGLGADAANPDAVAHLYDAKGRPAFNPLIAHLAYASDALQIGAFNAAAQKLAAAFWPGPLTLVVPYQGGARVCELARAGLGTVGIRIPDHPVAHALLAAFGGPVVGPSANRSGHVSPTEAAHVSEDLAGRIDAVLDSGPTRVGVESTIIDATGPELRLLRPGGITRAQVEALIGAPLADAVPNDVARPASPGRLLSHYAPRARVRLEATHIAPGEALLTFAGARPPGTEQAATILDLSPEGRLTEAAARLYGALRALDETGVPSIAVAPLPRTGLGEAIADRLGRAAAPRPG